MKKLWLIRHAESMSQVDDSVDGVNPDLSPYGELQARHLKSRISQIESDIVLLSPLTRAWRTYLLSEYVSANAMYDKRLIESDWGIPGYYPDSLFQGLPDIARADTGRAHCQPPQERASLLLDFVAETGYSSYMFLGHWGIFRQIAALFVGTADHTSISGETENTSISLLEIDNTSQRRVAFWNDSSHLHTLQPERVPPKIQADGT